MCRKWGLICKKSLEKKLQRILLFKKLFIMENTIGDHFVEISHLMNEIGWTVKRVEKKKDGSSLNIVLDQTHKEDNHSSVVEKLEERGYSIGMITVCKNLNEIHVDVDIDSEKNQQAFFLAIIEDL